MESSPYSGLDCYRCYVLKGVVVIINVTSKANPTLILVLSVKNAVLILGSGLLFHHHHRNILIRRKSVAF